MQFLTKDALDAHIVTKQQEKKVVQEANKSMLEMQKDESAYLVEYAKETDVHIVHMPGYHGKGGFTVAYRQHLSGTGKMVDIAVAYCSDKDTYSKRVGRNIAISNIMEERVITLPVGEKHKYDTESNIRYFFSKF